MAVNLCMARNANHYAQVFKLDDERYEFRLYREGADFLAKQYAFVPGNKAYVMDQFETWVEARNAKVLYVN